MDAESNDISNTSILAVMPSLCINTLAAQENGIWLCLAIQSLMG